jgi:cystathionine beta-synthase
MKVQIDAKHYGDAVRSAMTTSPQTLLPSASFEQLRDVLDSGLVAIVADESKFYGLITRFDLLNHLRRTLR